MTSRDNQAEEFLNSDTISDDFFIEIVENKLSIKREDFKLGLVLLSPATGKNENFMSVVYRAKIKFEILATKEKKSIDVIIKVLLAIMPEMKEMTVFARERFVYEDILSSFEKIWLERAGETVKFGPRSIKFESEPYEIIVLDDLKAEGFLVLDRKVGLNMQQTKLLLSRIAKFHAASAIRHQKDGLIHKQFDRKVSMPEFPADSPMMNGVLRMFKSFASSITGYEGCKAFGEKISRWDTSRFMKEWTNVGLPMRCGFQVLCHGDMWLNNMMFKTGEDGSALDVSLIDYQMPNWGSPAGDLLYFLLSSVEDAIKVDHFDDFVVFYHEELTKSLKALKYDQRFPTLTDLQIDLLDKGSFGCTCLLFIVTIVKYNSSHEIDMSDLISGPENPEMLERMYNNENFRKSMQLWLPFLNKRGFLDTLIKQDENVEVKNDE